MQKIELIALDLDGTALTPENTVSDSPRPARREGGFRRERGEGGGAAAPPDAEIFGGFLAEKRKRL